MSLCDCPGRPKCEWQWCEDYADWSVYQPWRRSDRGRFTLMCCIHYAIYQDACSRPMPGIDRPENAEDEWRPSLSDHIRLAELAMAFNDKQKQPQQDDGDMSWHYSQRDRKYTPGQLAQIRTLRKGLREMREALSKRTARRKP